jgi:hypothetical protein
MSQTSISRELAELFQVDQADRQSPDQVSREQLEAMARRDEQRRARVREIVRQGPFPSAEDYFHAAMLLYHGKTSEELLLAHQLATIAGFKGHRLGKWLCAVTLDRFLESVGQPQPFGTQYRRDASGKWTVEPMDHSLPEAVRAEYGVPPLAEQLKRAEAMNQAKERSQP